MAVAFRDELAHHLQGQNLVRADKYGMVNDFAAILSEPRAIPKKKRVKKADPAPRHFIIPDCQVEPGTPTVHLEWIGQYIVDQYAGTPLTVINLGDFWNMGSLSTYDKKGGRLMEGRRVIADIIAGNRGMDLLRGAHTAYNQTKAKNRQWEPDWHLLLGNHEDRITRAVESDAQLEGLLSLEMLNAKAWGWKVHDFKDVVTLDGVAYSHYFYNQNTGRPLGGSNAETRLRTIGHSFTMGHQQGLLYGVRTLANGQMQHALVAGSCYLHSEEYRGAQANGEWRGVIVCNQVEKGSYDPMFVSLDYLCRRYEGMRLAQFRKKYL